MDGDVGDEVAEAVTTRATAVTRPVYRAAVTPEHSPPGSAGGRTERTCTVGTSVLAAPFAVAVSGCGGSGGDDRWGKGYTIEAAEA